ncbi:uncharacterized protein LOC126247413 [Schistocerca nitens]|uniref:uncharacterized protein LOC126247413 n=1 Tax=Schistocerca nitens TaxID=7011 RepID=UPI002117A453|nr:uncharacterized protein LOC126247413 [Schistocerca nitens]
MCKWFITFSTVLMTASDSVVSGSVSLASTHTYELTNMKAPDMEPQIFLGSKYLCHNSSVKRRSFRDESEVCFWNNPCANIGVCQPRPDKPAGFICKCYEQFYIGEECIVGRLQERNYCDENNDLCQNGGSCKPMWGSYFCECSDEYEGRKCENRKNGETTRMSQPVFLYDIDTGTTNSCTFLLFFKKKNVGHNFTFTLYLNEIKIFDAHKEDMYLEVPSKWKVSLKSKHLTSKFIDDVTYCYHWKMQFFFVHQSVNAGIKLYNNGKVQFEDNYFINITRDPGKCVPNLELNDW